MIEPAAYSFLWQGLSICPLFFVFFNFLCGPLGRQNQIDSKFSIFFFFFVNYHLIWLLGRDQVIRLYLKIAENLMRFIL